MSDSVIIAEVSKGAISPVTAELVSAAKAYGTNPVMVIPCTDASIADGSGYDGVSRVIAVKGDCFANYDAASWASDLQQSFGVIFAATTPQSKDLLARIAAKERCLWYKML